MFDIKNIFEPSTLREALEIYHSNKDLKIIAGGTDILINLRHGKMEKVQLVSLRKVKELDYIKRNDDKSISIGAMSSFSSIYRSKIIQDHIPILGEAAVSMGGPQIRNIATIGGNISNGAVSADSAPSLFALNAMVRLESVSGVRMIPIVDFYAGPGKVNINNDEILTEILIMEDDYKNMKGKYIKFSNRKAMDIAMLSVAVLCKVENESFHDLRIALGVSAPTPIRCKEAETYAKGNTINEDTIKEIGNLAMKEAMPRDSWRGSKDYREHLITVLTQRAIKELVGGIVNG